MKYKKHENVWKENMGIQPYSHCKGVVLTPVRGVGTLIWETDRSGDQRPRWSAEILMPQCLLVVTDRYRDIRRLEEFFLHNACYLRAFVCWTGASTTRVNFGKRP